MKDPNNIDAEIEFACMRPSAQEAIKILIESEKKGTSALYRSTASVLRMLGPPKARKYSSGIEGPSCLTKRVATLESSGTF